MYLSISHLLCPSPSMSYSSKLLFSSCNHIFLTQNRLCFPNWSFLAHHLSFLPLYFMTPNIVTHKEIKFLIFSVLSNIPWIHFPRCLSKLFPLGSLVNVLSVLLITLYSSPCSCILFYNSLLWVGPFLLGSSNLSYSLSLSKPVLSLVRYLSFSCFFISRDSTLDFCHLRYYVGLLRILITLQRIA